MATLDGDDFLKLAAPSWTNADSEQGELSAIGAALIDIAKSLRTLVEIQQTIAEQAPGVLRA